MAEHLQQQQEACATQPLAGGPASEEGVPEYMNTVWQKVESEQMTAAQTLKNRAVEHVRWRKSDDRKIDVAMEAMIEQLLEHLYTHPMFPMWTSATAVDYKDVAAQPAVGARSS